MDELIKLLDEHLDYIRHEMIGNTIYIYVKTNRNDALCPYCGQSSTKKHSIYERRLQVLPIMGQKTKLILFNRKMFCCNSDCSHTTFAETFSFFSPRSQKTKRLLDKIMNVSLHVSSLTAVNILKDGIADIGKSTICNLLKKEIALPRKETITKVCIDDFAFRKRYTYGTIMVDMETHQIIDLLSSREINDVTEWLKSYPNIKVISRDGSVSYHSAIKKVSENIQQVSDRFHLLKGFTDAAKKFLTRFLVANISLYPNISHYNRIDQEDYWKRPCTEDFPTREHNANLEKKQKMIQKVRKLKEMGFNHVKIAKEVGIHRVTVAKYLKTDYNAISGKYNTAIPSKIKPYAKDIKQLLSEGKSFHQIYTYICEKGYTGAKSTIRMYATRERKLIKEVDGTSNEKIERRWLIKLLYKPISEIKELRQEQLEQVIKQYPIIGMIYDVGKNFKEILFSKEAEKLEKWMEESTLLNIEEITSFVNGLKRDLEAVKNAIKMDYNNGLAEGSVNKLKVIKRIMYGRSSFELLKAKVLRLELSRKIN